MQTTCTNRKVSERSAPSSDGNVPCNQKKGGPGKKEKDATTRVSSHRRSIVVDAPESCIPCSRLRNGSSSFCERRASARACFSLFTHKKTTLPASEQAIVVSEIKAVEQLNAVVMLLSTQFELGVQPDRTKSARSKNPPTSSSSNRAAEKSC